MVKRLRIPYLSVVIMLLGLVITLAGTGCGVGKSGVMPGSPSKPGPPNLNQFNTVNPGQSNSGPPTPPDSNKPAATWSTAPGAVKVALPDNVVSNMKSKLLSFVYGHFEPSNSVMHYGIRSLHITIQRETRNDNQVEMDFLVGYEHRLDIARPEDAPVIKGMVDYLNENRNSLSPQDLKVVNNLIATWKSQISSYMNTYTPSYDSYVDKARVDSHNNLVPGTSMLYVEEDYTAGGLLSADKANMTATDQEVEQQSYDAAKTAVEGE